MGVDHGVSMKNADINACEQTPEGLSAQMFDGEDFDTWHVQQLGHTKPIVLTDESD